MAEAGKAVSLYFEERLKEIYPEQNFPIIPENDPSTDKEKEEAGAGGGGGAAAATATAAADEEVTEDSDEDIQPKRKRLKTEKPMHIK